MVNIKLTNHIKIFYILFFSIWWLIVAVAVIRTDNTMWKEILAYSFVLPILFASYYGKVPGLFLSMLSSIVSGSQAINEFLVLSPFAQRILFQILFINTVALVTTSLSEREQKAKASYQQLFSNVPIGLFRINSTGYFVNINPALVHMLAIDTGRNPNIYNLKDFFINYNQFAHLFENNDEDNKVKSFQVMLRKKDNTIIWVQIKCRQTENNDDIQTITEYEGSIEDVSERVCLYEKVKKMATYDSLTGVFNRGYFLMMAEQIFQHALQYRHQLSILLMDIDYFKKINDTYGHPVGDKVLNEVAGFIMRTVRNTDIFGRYGGDEFVLFLPEQGYESAITTANRIREGVQKTSLVFDNKPVSFTISIGISILDFENDKNIDDLIKRADLSMYQAKKNGRNMVVS